MKNMFERQRIGQMKVDVEIPKGKKWTVLKHSEDLKARYFST